MHDHLGITPHVLIQVDSRPEAAETGGVCARVDRMCRH